MIALAMVLIQCSEAFQPKVTDVRQLIRDRYSDKHEPVMARFGAILAQVSIFLCLMIYSSLNHFISSSFYMSDVFHSFELLLRIYRELLMQEDEMSLLHSVVDQDTEV
jgi:hypothetical protein